MESTPCVVYTRAFSFLGFVQPILLHVESFSILHVVSSTCLFLVVHTASNFSLLFHKFLFPLLWALCFCMGVFVVHFLALRTTHALTVSSTDITVLVRHRQRARCRIQLHSCYSVWACVAVLLCVRVLWNSSVVLGDIRKHGTYAVTPPLRQVPRLVWG